MSSRTRSVYKRICLTAAICCFLIGQVAYGADFPVTNTNNAGLGSLRQAILDANAAGDGPHAIVFNVQGVINIGTGLPGVAVSGVTIDGADRITINAGNTASNIFTINAGVSDVTIQNLTLLNTRADGFYLAGNNTGITIQNIAINTAGTAADRINAIVRVVGATEKLTLQGISSAHGLETLTTTHGRAFYFAAGNHTNLLMEDIDIEGRDEAGGYVDNMFAQFVAPASVDTATFRNITHANLGFGMHFGGTLKNAVFENVTLGQFTNGIRYGIVLGGASENVTFRDVRIDLKNVLGGANPEADYGIHMVAAAQSITFEGVEVIQGGINSLRFGSTASDITITNSKFINFVTNHNSTNNTVLFVGAVNGLVMDNVEIGGDPADKNGLGMLFQAAVTDGEFSNIAVRNTVGAAIQFDLAVTNLMLDRLTISGTGEGVAVRNAATGLQITNSTISNVGGAVSEGIEIYGNFPHTGVIISDNTIETTGRSGIIVHTSHASAEYTISGNTVRNVPSHGIWVHTGDGAKDVNITDNIVYDNGGSGVFLNNGPDRVLIRQNSVYNNAIKGIELNGTSNGLYVGATHRPVLVSSTPTGTGEYELEITTPNIAGPFEIDIYANDNGVAASSGQHYVTTLTNVPANSTTTHTVSYSGTGFWTATLNSTAATAGTSEFSNPLPIGMQGPAGVNDGIVAWYRADQGAEGSGWADFSGMANHMIPVSDPDTVKRWVNFNPAVYYDGNDAHRAPATAGVTGAYTLGGLAQLEGSLTGRTFASSTGNKLFGFQGTFEDRLHLEGWLHTGQAATEDTRFYAFKRAAAGAWDLRSDGASITTGASSNASEWRFEIGGAAFNNFSRMSVPEAFVYSRNLAGDEMSRIESYMALKYGITMRDDGGNPRNYVTSDGTTMMWTAAENTGYGYRITGIGRDDVSLLQQKQSLNQQGGIVTMALGENIAVSNAANSNDITQDKTFLFFSDNNGSTQYTEAVTATNTSSRMGRVWRVQKSAGWDDSQSITLRLDGGTESNYLLISTDEAFGTIGQELRLSSAGTVTLSSADLPNGTYFTFGRQQRQPGGVLAGLQAWVKADEGVRLAAADDATHWTDQAPVERIWPKAATSALTWEKAAINFNPGIHFPGANYFTLPDFIGTNFTAGEVFSVQYSNVDNNTTARFPFELGGSGNGGQAVFYNYSNGNIYTHFGRADRPGFSLQGKNMRLPRLMNNWSAPNDWGLYMDGLELGHLTTSFTPNFTSPAGAKAYIGAGHISVFNGRISEVVLFDRKLNDTERQQVNSYLALKYGLTLTDAAGDPSDYLASNGTTRMWTAADNTGYGQRITGIGRDENGTLNQKQSRAQADGANVSMALGDDFAVSNLDNTNTIANDLSFFTFSDNGQAAVYTQPLTGLGELTMHMARVYKIDQTNWATGNITLQLDGGDNTVSLIVSADDSFGSGDAVYPLDDQGRVTVSSDLLADGAYFTFGNTLRGPGRVANNIALWLRADDGVDVAGNNATKWNDYSGMGNSTTGAVGSILYQEANMNFNPALNFTNLSTDAFDGTPLNMAGSGNYALFFVVNPLTDLNGGDLFVMAEQTNRGRVEYLAAAGGQYQMIFNNSGLTPGGAFANKPHIAGFVAGGGNGTGYLNGLAGTAQTPGTIMADAAGNYNIGDVVNNGDALGADISEVIVYSGTPNAAEVQRINSYLALKYGITLDQTTPTDYLASDGTTNMWTAADNTGYANRIMGLGRDDASKLYQRQSRSVSSGNILTMALGSAIVESNTGNGGTIANDLSFLVFSDDAAGLLYKTAVTGFAEFQYRMDRTWKVDKTNWADGDITIGVDGGNPDTYLIVSADDTFDSSDNIFAFSDSTVTLNSSDLPDGSYFTFGKHIRVPNGVQDGLNFWLRADDGVSSSSLWKDYSGYGHDAVRAAVAGQPVTDARALNFNYAMRFDGTDDFMDITSTRVDPANSTIFAVGSASYIGTIGRDLISSGAVGANQGMEFRVVPGGKLQYLENATTVQGVTGTATISLDKPYIFGSTQDNSTNGVSLFENHQLDIQGTINLTPNIANLVSIGSRTMSGRNLFWQGPIGEVIVYDRVLSDAERQLVESYLGLKYGITLNGGNTDYLASDGSAYWTAGSDWKNRITGIGRDDTTALNTKQSLSVDTGMVTLALGDKIALTNEANEAAITADKSFFVFADNGLPASGYGVVVTGGTNVTRRMERTWQVQRTDNWADQNITLKADAQGGEVYLLISETDPDFATLSQELPLNPDGTVTFNSSLLPDGAYFTFGAQVKYPGGVAGGLLWLRADIGAGGSDGEVLSLWSDQSDQSNHGTQATAASQPVYRNNAADNVNFNPVLAFDGTNDYMDIASNLGITGSAEFTLFGMTTRGSANTNDAFFNQQGNQTGGLSYFWVPNGRLALAPINLGEHGATTANSYDPNVPYFVSGSRRGNVLNLYVNGLQDGTQANASGFVLNDQNYRVGDRGLAADPSNMTFHGKLGEIIAYAAPLTDEEIQRVHTYLAIKYGITLGQNTPTNYLATDGTVIWDAAANSTYYNNVAGIGRDNQEALHQKQSRSENDGLQVVIGLGSLADNNLAHTGSFTDDLSYLVWGDDSASTVFQTAITGHPEVNYRMSRVWKVQETGTVGNVQVAVPLPGGLSSPQLIISDDATFDASDQYIALSTVTINGEEYYAGPADLTNGQYFTFAARVTAPGGVLGAALWVKANAGVETNTDNHVEQWLDQSGSGNAVTELRAAAITHEDPIAPSTDILQVPNAINFNPAVDFSGATTRSLKGNAATGWNEGPTTIFGVSIVEGAIPGTFGGIFSGLANWTTDNGASAGVGLNATATYYSLDGSGCSPGAMPMTTNEMPRVVRGVYVTPGNGLNARLAVNGLVGLTAGANCVNSAGTFFEVGGRTAGSTIYDNRVFNGKIPEVIAYNSELSPMENNRVESYLAIKYGLSLDQTTPLNYVASDSSVIWDATASGAYNVNIFGVGRDDASALDQKQSRSVHPGSILTIGREVILEDNVSNTAAFTDDISFVTMASNSNATTLTGADLPTVSCITERLTQEWKVQFTNYDNNALPLALSFDLSGITYTGEDIRDFTLLVDEDGDGDFTTGTIREIAASDYLDSISRVTFENVTGLTTGMVFTLTTDHPVRTAYLVADGAEAGSSSICMEGEWVYFTDPSDPTRYIAALHPNGNTIDVAQLSLAVVDVNDDMAALGANSGTDYGTQLMRRLVQISYGGDSLTVNGGVILRLLWDPAEQTAAENYLSMTRGVTADQTWTWFKHDGDITATLADLGAGGLQNITALVPSGSGQVDAIDYVEFTIPAFSTFGGVATANKVVNIAAVQDGEEAGPQNGIFDISLPPGVTADEDITVSYTLSGDAGSGSDYLQLDGQIIVPAGENTVQLVIQVNDDEVIELDEFVTAELTAATGAGGDAWALGADSAAVRILDNDRTDPTKTVLELMASVQDAAEPNINGEFVISLPSGITSSEDITVDYTIGGTATPDGDYTSITASIVIPANQSSVTVPVGVLSDMIVEVTETVVMTTSGGSSTNFVFTAGAANQDIVNISDDAAYLELNVTATLPDAAEPGTAGEFTVSLPAGATSSEDITVNYTVAGTAAADGDYTAITAAVVIPAGQNGVTVPVAVLDDDMIETDETVVMTITGGSSASFTFTAGPNDEASVVLADDDRTDPAKMLLSVATAADAAEPGMAGEFMVRLPTGVTSSEDITVSYSILAGSTATAGVDYTAITGGVIIPAGSNSVVVPVTVTDDQIIELDETVVMNITGGSSASFNFAVSANDEATVVVADDDRSDPAKTVLSVTASVSDAAEPDVDGEFTVSLPTGVTSSQDININYTVTGTAAAGDDYTAITGVLTIPAGQNSIAVPVGVLPDMTIEGAETVVMTITGGTSTDFSFTAGAGDAATVTIADDPVALELNIAASAAGAEPGTDGEFTVSLPAGATSTEDITVHYTVAGTAAADGDYTAITAAVVIPAGQNGVAVPVAVLDDDIIETDETVVMTITGGSSASFTYTAGANGEATVAIADDERSDPASQVLTVTASAPDAAEPGTDGEFTVSLPAGITASENIQINYTIGGTGAAATDYVALPTSVVLVAGQNSVLLPVDVLDDRIIEGDETVVLEITGGSSASFSFTAGAANSATVTIADNESSDPANLQLSLSAIQNAAEPSTNGEFQISLPAGITSAADIGVSYTISGTAAGGTDYAAITGTLVIPAGQNSTMVPVDVLDDAIIEPSETVVLEISGGNDGQYAYTVAAGASSATVNIADDDYNGNSSVILVTRVSDAIEGGAMGQYRISLPEGFVASEDITVNFTMSGTATRGTGNDYELGLGAVITAVLPAGDNAILIDVEAYNDGIIEGPETVVMTLTGASSSSLGFTIDPDNGSAQVDVVDINGSEESPLSIVHVSDGAEPGTDGLFRVSLPPGITSAYPISVALNIGGTALQGSDYQSLPAVTIPANTGSVDVPVNVLDDQLIELAETSVIELLSGSATDGGGASYVFPADPAAYTVTVNISDDDNTAANRVLSASTEADASEPSTSGSYRISLPAGYTASSDITVSYTLDGTAMISEDYTVASATSIMLPAYRNSVLLPVTVRDDKIIEGEEQVQLTVASGSSASGDDYTSGGGAVALAIGDDDATAANQMLSVTASMPDAAEPDVDGEFRVSLPSGITSKEEITVNYTMSGTAAAGDDYTAITGVLVIPAGQNSIAVPVDVLADMTIEGPETVVMTITGGSSASFSFTAGASGAATVTIADDPVALELNIAASAAGAEPGTDGEFTVSLPAGATS
ncbi:Calx-beta domain-containing protein, partial [Parapedobacter sp. GCM10030251]|uniref:Calx-beta domain-containing protein n=1 Tax=Parapedobacter sp. GCM10030251 TaxID=3273419 RepID=UPI00360FDD58